MFRIGKSIRQRLQSWLPGTGRREWEVMLMGMEFLLKVMKMFWNQVVMNIIQPCEYTRKHRIVHFKGVNFMVCELNLNAGIIKIHFKFISIIVLL